ncbi:hypothetical protein [Nocardia sp. NPDC004860]|uniref:hypothetical protein n=1 Tax=Nocardia sp. NPDC004860 TaxID=3154557 RepID=UPI0033BF895D
MTNPRITVEPVVDHEYRVLVDDGTDSAESQFIVAPDVLADLRARVPLRGVRYGRGGGRQRSRRGIR